MAELVDALVSNTSGCKSVPVRPRPSVPISHTLIIYAHNSESALKKTLSHHISQFNDIVIVDDDSQDETVDYIKTHFDETCHMIKNPYFMGYAASINTAIEHAKTDWVIVCHADTKMELSLYTESTPFSPSSDSSSDNIIAIIPGELAPLKFSFQTGQRSCNIAGKLSQAIAINRDKFRHMGGLDPLYYPGGYEWADLLYLAQQRGWQVQSDPEWKVTTGQDLISHWYDVRQQKKILTIRNELLLTWKTTDKIIYWVVHSSVMLMSLFLFRIQLFRGVFHACRRLTILYHSRKMRGPILGG